MGVQALKIHSEWTKHGKASALVASSTHIYNIFPKTTQTKANLKELATKSSVYNSRKTTSNSNSIVISINSNRIEMQGSHKFYGPLLS